MVVDSMCSMSFTVVVKARSEFVVIRLVISSGPIPVNVQMTLTTGISTTGKISTGVLKIDTTPRIRMNNDMTMKVYGRRSASLTIHINYLPRFCTAVPPGYGFIGYDSAMINKQASPVFSYLAQSGWFLRNPNSKWGWGK